MVALAGVGCFGLVRSQLVAVQLRIELPLSRSPSDLLLRTTFTHDLNDHKGLAY